MGIFLLLMESEHYISYFSSFLLKVLKQHDSGPLLTFLSFSLIMVMPLANIAISRSIPPLYVTISVSQARTLLLLQIFRTLELMPPLAFFSKPLITYRQSLRHVLMHLDIACFL